MGVRGGFFRASRTTCIVRVLPPLTTRPRFQLRTRARASASGSTPGWRSKRLSSWTIRAAANFFGTPVPGGKRHWPSAASLASKSSPSRLNRIGEKGSRNTAPLGPAQKASQRPAAAPIRARRERRPIAPRRSR